MARKIVRFLARVDDVLEVVVMSMIRFAFSRRGAILASLMAAGLVATLMIGSRPPDQGLQDGALVPALTGPDLDAQIADLELDDENLLGVRPVTITVDAIVGRHGDHAALVTYQGRSYRARPGTLIPQDGPPSFVVTRVGCDSVEAYDWMARQTVKSTYAKPEPVLPAGNGTEDPTE